MSKITEEERLELAKKALESGSYLEFRGETFRINAVENGYVLVDDPDEHESHDVTIDEFVADRSSKVFELKPTFDNSLEDPRIINYSISAGKLNSIMESAGGLFETIMESLDLDRY